MYGGHEMGVLKIKLTGDIEIHLSDGRVFLVENKYIFDGMYLDRILTSVVSDGHRKDYPRLDIALNDIFYSMTLEQAFEGLLKKWKDQDSTFKAKYKSYKSKYLRSKRDKKAEKIGYGIMREMLLQAKYVECWKEPEQ